MAKPFGNMTQLTGDILDSYIMGLQAGNTPDAAGLDEMKYVRVDKLRRYIREGLVTAYTPRENSSSATPNSPQVGDIFMCTGEFTESGINYQLNHFYVYTTQLIWEDITAGIKGPKGDVGVTPLFSIGEVTYGDTPDVTIDMDDPTHPVLNFVLKTSEVGVVDNLNSSSSVDALSAKQGSNLKNALQANSQRIENLEVAVSGSLVQTNTDATQAKTKVITNANEILPWAILKRVGARATQFNQIVPALDDISKYNCSVTSYDSTTHTGTITNFSDSSASMYNSNGCVSGHYYYVHIEFNASKAVTLRMTFGSSNRTFNASANTWHSWDLIQPANGATFALAPNSSGDLASSDTVQVKNFFGCDLTTMSMYDSGKTDAQNIANFRAKFPASYYPHDTGHIYDLNPEGFLIRGVNLWDEEWEVGDISDSTGAKTTASDRIRSKNYIPVNPSTEYYFLVPTGNGRFFYYDAEKNFISVASWGVNTYRTTPQGCAFVLFTTNATYGTIYNHDIQIADNSLPTAVKTAYHPYDGRIVDTPQIADGHYVNENVYDYVENVIEDGIVKGKKHTVVGVVDLENLTWSMVTGIPVWQADLDVKPVSVSSEDAPMLCDTYTPSHEEYLSQRTGEIAITTTGKVRVNNGSSSISPTGNLYYELATDTITDCDPIPNIPCENGTSVTAITPQTDLVNAVDVPSMIAYMTKIAS